MESQKFRPISPKSISAQPLFRRLEHAASPWAQHALMDKQELQKALAAEDAAAGASSSHALASEATEMEASVERFLDEALIDEFKSTPLHTLEGVLEERKELEERRERIRARSEQLLKEELAKQKHEREVQELQDAIKEREAEDAKVVAASKAKPGPTGRRSGAPDGSGAGAGAPPPAATQTKLTGAGRSKNLKPYVYDHTDFLGAADANRNASALKKENDMLRQCLQDSRKPGAFEAYLRANTTY